MVAQSTGSEGGEAKDLAEAEIHAIRDTGLVETRRNQILDASLRLFLEKGFAATTVREICAASGVNQASLYDYIANKQDILRRLLNRLWFDRQVERLVDRLAAASSDRALSSILVEYYRENWRERRDGILLAYRSVPHLAEEDKRTLRAREERLIGELSKTLALRTGAAEGDPRVRTIANFMIYLNAFGPMRDWLMTPEEADMALDMVAAGIDGMVEAIRRG